MGLFGDDFRVRPFNGIFKALVLLCSNFSTMCSAMWDNFEEDVMVLHILLRVWANDRQICLQVTAGFAYNSFYTVEEWLQSMLTTCVLLPDVQARTHTSVVTCQVPPRIAMQLVEQKGCKVMRFSGKIFLHVAHLGNSRLGICSSITENMISNTIYLCNISSILKMLQGIS